MDNMLTIFRDLFFPPRHMFLLIIAAWVGLMLAENRAERHGVKKDDLNNLIFNGIIASIVGGRASFILQNIPAFIKKPLDIVSINPDIFDPIGALAVGFIAALIYGQRKKLSFWHSLDTLSPFFAILAIGLGLSHLAAGTYFGKETDLPWGINLWNAVRHPTQIYETLTSLLIFGLLWFKEQSPRPGIDFIIFAASTAFSQLIIQSFRADSALIFNGIRQGQVFAWIILAICFVLFEVRLAIQPEQTRG